MPPQAVTTLREALTGARSQIEALGSDEAALEAELLLMHALGVDRAPLYARLQDPLKADVSETFEALLKRRLAHEPVAYITGHREFFGLDFEVSPAALIPRPETETLVELTLAFAREHRGDITIADIGTGAGTIAISLASQLASARITATDVSQEALELARRNAKQLGVSERIDFRPGDLLWPLESPVEILVANLPYVTTAQWQPMPPEIREHEPHSALDGGVDGLDIIRRLLNDAPSRLAPNGALFCEIGDWQGDTVRSLAAKAFPNARIEVHPDLAGRDRVLAVYC